eukprot:COSAG03_NODE_2101_length_3123_cov_69.440807_1_plen_308_part_10
MRPTGHRHAGQWVSKSESRHLASHGGHGGTESPQSESPVVRRVAGGAGGRGWQSVAELAAPESRPERMTMAMGALSRSFLLLSMSAVPAFGAAPPATAPASAFADELRFAREFEALRTEIHLLSKEEAGRRFSAMKRRAQPPHQDKVDHMVVLFMENRAFDHIFGCMLGDKEGVDGIPSTGHRIPVDPNNASAGTVNVTCGTADLVCTGGNGYSLFNGKGAPGANMGTYPYGKQSDAFSVANGAKQGPTVNMFNASQVCHTHTCDLLIKCPYGSNKSLCGTDAWAATFDELLTLDEARTDAPMHFPEP